MREVSKDREKAKSLKKMAEKILDRLSDTKKEEYPSQSLVDYYKAIHCLMEALASTKGVKSSGEGAHKKLIDWVVEERGLQESRRRFLQQVRKHRNRIVYEGFVIEESYIERNEKELEKIYQSLKQELENLLN